MLNEIFNAKYIASATVFAILGTFLLLCFFFLFDKLTPGNLWKEIIEEHNIAVAITVGAMTIGLAIIIASAIHG